MWAWAGQGFSAPALYSGKGFPIFATAKYNGREEMKQYPAQQAGLPGRARNWGPPRQMSIVRQLQLEINIQSEVSQKKKDKYHMISLTCGI